ncbi:hypothetical protein BMG05_04425 [Mycobacterium malmoense]|nr:hypothetical protein BMG05_04425 [Mycobacterium malmoense]
MKVGQVLGHRTGCDDCRAGQGDSSSDVGAGCEIHDHLLCTTLDNDELDELNVLTKYIERIMTIK